MCLFYSVNTSDMAFSVMTSCSLDDTNFLKTVLHQMVTTYKAILSLHLKVMGSSETSVATYMTTNPENNAQVENGKVSYFFRCTKS
jgi:hypothetical protein